MKKTVIGFVVGSLLGLGGNLVFAQESANQAPTDPPAANRPAHQMVDPSVQAQHLSKRLKLTADQQTQVLNILSAQRDQVSGLRSDGTLSQADRHSKMQGIRADTESKIRAILTDDQKQTFDQLQQKRLEKQHERKG